MSAARNDWTVNGYRLCVECLTKHPTTEMTQMQDGRWICNEHTEEGK